MSERIPARQDIAAEYKWKIEDIYASDEAWESDLKKLRGSAEKIAAYKGRLSQAEPLCEFLRYDDELSVLLDSLGNYAQRKNDEDTRVALYQDMVSRFETACVEISGASAFVVPEIIAIPDEDYERLFAQCEGLKLYRRNLDRIRSRRAHTLSEAEERLMALSGEVMGTPDAVFSMLNDADLKFPDAADSEGKLHQVTHESYIPLVQSEDRPLRKNAFEALYHDYEGYKNTFAAVLAGQVKTLVCRARARRYENTLHAALD